MEPTFWSRLFSRSNTVWVSCFLAGTSQIALVALLIGIITKDTSLESWLEGIAWAASIVHIVALLVLPITAFLFLRRTSNIVQTTFGAVSILLSLPAAILSIYVLAKIWEGLDQQADQDKLDVGDVRSMSQAGFAVWATAIVAQLAVFTLLFWPPFHHKDTTSSPEEPTTRSSPVRSLKRSLSIQLSALSAPSTPRFARSSEPSSPTTPTLRSPSTASLRHSMDRVVRPMTSKTKLLLQKAQSLHSERRHSLDTIGQDDDFGDWDTSSPADIIPLPSAEPIIRPTTRTRLPTIPGSRPVSPANPLEGPFYPDGEADVAEQACAPDPSLPKPSFSSPSATSSVRRDSNSRSDSTASCTASRSPSCCDSTTVADEHQQRTIHPLFRPESPAPAPAIRSPGTWVYGHPQGGKVWDPAHGPRPETPRSRQGSFRGVGGTSGAETGEVGGVGGVEGGFVLKRPAPAFAEERGAMGECFSLRDGDLHRRAMKPVDAHDYSKAAQESRLNWTLRRSPASQQLNKRFSATALAPPTSAPGDVNRPALQHIIDTQNINPNTAPTNWCSAREPRNNGFQRSIYFPSPPRPTRVLLSSRAQQRRER
ncbi:uncharacterized protein LTR77_002639 [Saxophila tyrrhenica]|uniref:Uncharacterized protein n=1 Tax=Saxophila tyrrhenica TaxID=1690608 RepID=A0AAV9PHZ5_9PEZI|nr:hypothetical protein LTR77_002639 [Saxophila tyrrhenica]